MAIAERELNKPKVLTYDEYLNEGETPGRYEIIDGVRHWMTATYDFHQDIVQQILFSFMQYQIRTRTARAYVAPIDILTQRDPLKVRQPDVMLISTARYGKRQGTDPAPWIVAPEIVVEVLSRNETKRQIDKKLTEYASVNVLEAWLVHPMRRTIEQWQLSSTNPATLVGAYTDGHKLIAMSFPDLEIDVTEAFEH